MSRNLFLIALAIGSLVSTAVFGLLSWSCNDDWWKGIWADLAITSLGIFVTVVLVDRTLELHENRRWQEFNDLANMEIRQFCASSMFLLIRRDPDHDRRWKFMYPGDVLRTLLRGSHWPLLFERDGWRQHVAETIPEEMLAFLTGWKVDDDPLDDPIDYSHAWADSVMVHLQEVLQLFSTSMQPDQLLLLLEIRNGLQRIKMNGHWEHGIDDASDGVKSVLGLLVQLLDATPELDWHSYYIREDIGS